MRFYNYLKKSVLKNIIDKKVLGQLPPKEISLNPNHNCNPNLNPSRGLIFPGENCPGTDKNK